MEVMAMTSKKLWSVILLLAVLGPSGVPSSVVAAAAKQAPTPRRKKSKRGTKRTTASRHPGKKRKISGSKKPRRMRGRRRPARKKVMPKGRAVRRQIRGKRGRVGVLARRPSIPAAFQLALPPAVQPTPVPLPTHPHPHQLPRQQPEPPRRILEIFTLGPARVAGVQEQRGNISIKQVNVLNQLGPDGGGGASCGYHALKNALSITRAYAGQDDSDLLLHNLLNPKAVNLRFGPKGDWREEIMRDRNRQAMQEYVKRRLLGLLKDPDRFARVAPTIEHWRSQNPPVPWTDIPAASSQLISADDVQFYLRFTRWREILGGLASAVAQQIIKSKIYVQVDQKVIERIRSSAEEQARTKKQAFPAMDANDLNLASLPMTFLPNQIPEAYAEYNQAVEEGRLPATRLYENGDELGSGEIERLVRLTRAQWPGGEGEVTVLQSVASHDQAGQQVLDDPADQQRLEQIRNNMRTQLNYRHAFIVNSATPESPYGHWTALVLNQADGKREYVIADSAMNQLDEVSYFTIPEGAPMQLIGLLEA